MGTKNFEHLVFLCKNWPNDPFKTFYVATKGLEEFGVNEEDYFNVLESQFDHTNMKDVKDIVLEPWWTFEILFRI